MFDPDLQQIGFIKINQLDHGSHLFIGCNKLVSVHTNGKKQQGFGQQGADDVRIILPVMVISEEDADDSRVKKVSFNLD